MYDALTSKRVYKDAFGHIMPAKMIIEESGTHFDPAWSTGFSSARRSSWQSLAQEFQRRLSRGYVHRARGWARSDLLSSKGIVPLVPRDVPAGVSCAIEPVFQGFNIIKSIYRSIAMALAVPAICRADDVKTVTDPATGVTYQENRQ